MRQTDLSLEQVVEMIASGGGPRYPRCLLVNELGQMAKAGARQALTELAELLVHEEDEVRAVAYAYLCDIDDAEQRPHLDDFRARPQNARIVSWFKENYGITPPAA